MNDNQRRDEIAGTVRRVLAARLGRRLDELERACLDLAADAAATVLILDARMKFGPLHDDQAAAYVAACRSRDGALKALGVANPYRARGM
jgi:hypothetical protein